MKKINMFTISAFLLIIFTVVDAALLLLRPSLFLAFSALLLLMMSISIGLISSDYSKPELHISNDKKMIQVISNIIAWESIYIIDTYLIQNGIDFNPEKLSVDDYAKLHKELRDVVKRDIITGLNESVDKNN